MDSTISGNETPVTLPSAESVAVSQAVTVQPPLTRRGKGPALILLVPSDIDLSGSPRTLDPPPLQKWAEEGYAVAQVVVTHVSALKYDLMLSFEALSKLKECDQADSAGLISYNVLPTTELSDTINSNNAISAVITYGQTGIDTSKPQLRHITDTAQDTKSKDTSSSKTFYYQDTGPFFTIPAHRDFRGSPASIAHTRCLTFLKPIINGPYFDLEGIWEEHTLYEFAERAVEKTMGTMVQEPYVNHIPTMTGGIGRERLTNFYRNHFIFKNPADTALELVSRTVGIDRVIDEFVCSLTHDRVIDWLLPGIPPTGRYCEIPATSVVCIRGDRLYHEHITWDQATLLQQLGLLPDYLPFPYPLPDGKGQESRKRLEYRVPTAGIETAKKLMDENAIESNGMFKYAIREVDSD